MNRVQFAAAPGKVVSYWVQAERVVVDEWESFFISLAEFRKAIFDTALPQAKQYGATAWIVDTRAARGVLPDDVQAFIGDAGHRLFAAAGIKHFITVRPKSATAALSLQRVEKQVGPNGMQLVCVGSLDEAFQFLQGARVPRAA
jgi:hypothetical protein